MKLYQYPARSEWDKILSRPALDTQMVKDAVAAVLQDVRQHGDEALFRLEEKFDHVKLDRLLVSESEFSEAKESVDSDLYQSLLTAHANISRFHSSQRHVVERVETCPGVECWQKSIGIEKVGLYIPGGTAPLFSTVLMLAIPARLAGCREIVLCTPPNREGNIHPAILCAAHIAGVHKIFKLGGSQAIAAMAFGTESVPKVYKIFGPGNRFVMEAKQQVSLLGTAIDMPAGPSEVCVLADENSCAPFVAADLLSQAEHGIDSQVLLVSTSSAKIQEVEEEIDRQLPLLPRQDIVRQSLSNSIAILAADKQEAMEICNEYAPEHLILSTSDCDELADQVVNAGSVFLGSWSCESAGDYASGTNHTLPTHGYARAYSGLNLDSFCRKVTFQKLSEEGVLSIGPAVSTMAGHEQLAAHQQAMLLRLKAINSKS